MVQLTSPSEHQLGSEGFPPTKRSLREEANVERNVLQGQRLSRNRPCDACRRRKSRCVLNEGALKCVLCEFHAQDCTFIEKLLPRKRRYTSGEDELDRWLLICHGTLMLD